MARPLHAPKSALGIVIRERRDGRRGGDVAQEIGISQSTLSGLERGTHRPSLDTAVAVAKWLSWTVEQVIEAAQKPAEVK
jgi:DNA-binding XRE family transcriptional regulator